MIDFYTLLNPFINTHKTITNETKARKECNGLLHSQTIKRNNNTIPERNNKSVVSTYKWLNTVK